MPTSVSCNLAKMKVLIILATITLALAQQYAPINDPVKIIRHSAEVNPDGSYNYAYETANGIFAEEQAIPDKNGEEKVQGQYQYTSPEGQVIRLIYEADTDGFHPQGDHLPVGPSVPEWIQRALAWNAAHPEEDKL